MYRLDKSAFTIKNQTNEPKSYHYWLNKTAEERLKAAWYLIQSAYDCNLQYPPRLDRTVFQVKQRNV
jgi:hypothetical protein